MISHRSFMAQEGLMESPASPMRSKEVLAVSSIASEIRATVQSLLLSASPRSSSGDGSQNSPGASTLFHIWSIPRSPCSDAGSPSLSLPDASGCSPKNLIQDRRLEVGLVSPKSNLMPPPIDTVVVKKSTLQRSLSPTTKRQNAVLCLSPNSDSSSPVRATSAASQTTADFRREASPLPTRCPDDSPAQSSKTTENFSIVHIVTDSSSDSYCATWLSASSAPQKLSSSGKPPKPPSRQKRALSSGDLNSLTWRSVEGTLLRNLLSRGFSMRSQAEIRTALSELREVFRSITLAVLLLVLFGLLVLLTKPHGRS